MEKGEPLTDPDSRALEAALRTVDGEGNCFALLVSDDDKNHFMQAMGGPDEFTVEYREAGQHFRREDVRLDMVIAVFQAYRRGDEWWRRALIWQDVTREFQ
jgi:hypothetical protein